jgi:hypothetical protein
VVFSATTLAMVDPLPAWSARVRSQGVCYQFPDPMMETLCLLEYVERLAIVAKGAAVLAGLRRAQSRRPGRSRVDRAGFISRLNNAGCKAGRRNFKEWVGQGLLRGWPDEIPVWLNCWTRAVPRSGKSNFRFRIQAMIRCWTRPAQARLTVAIGERRDLPCMSRSSHAESIIRAAFLRSRA